MANNNSVERAIDFRKIAAIIKKNWMVLSRDGLRLRSLMIFPLVMIVLFGYTSGETPKHIPAALVDYDNSSHYSEIVKQELYANNQFSITHLVGSQDEGRALIDSGSINILFIIPPGFTSDINSGKTATISVIIDESDPSVAATTRASTQAFLQQLSQQITSSRISVIAASTDQFQQSLTYFPTTLDSSNQQGMESINKNFMDIEGTSLQSNSQVANSIQGLTNQLGPIVVDRNTVIYEYEHNYSVDPTGQATYDQLSVADAQAPILQQIGQYESISGTNNRLTQDAASMFSSSQNIYASLLEQNQMLNASNGEISSISSEMGVIANETQAAATTPIAYSEIEPYGYGRPGLDFLIPSILALVVFQGATFGMGRAIAGERQDGSLTRVFLTPTSNITILAGTLSFYIVFETIRASLLVFTAMILFGVSIKGSFLDILVLISIYAAGVTGLGMILSVLSKSQEQYMALSALVTLPAMLLGGVFIPVGTMPQFLQNITKVLPLTYASDALRGIMIKGFILAQVVPDIVFLAGFALFTMMISLVVFKRELL